MEILSASYGFLSSLYIGTKKEQFSASTRMHFIEAAVFSHRSRHFEQAQIRNTSQQTGLNQQLL
jgi:hypothetical protein